MPFESLFDFDDDDDTSMIEDGRCNCDDCVEARNKIRTMRLNRSWARSLFNTAVPIIAQVVNDLAGSYSRFTMDSIRDLPSDYLMFELPTGSIFSHKYGIAYSSGETSKFVERSDNAYKLVLPPLQRCEICGATNSITVKAGKYFAHPNCFRSAGYGGGNGLHVPSRYGTQPQKLSTFSFEFEMSKPTGSELVEQYDSVLVELIRDFQFKRTSDGTVSDEMVSPIYCSDEQFLKSLPLLNNAGKFVDSQCGTHVHVGMTDYPRSYFSGVHPHFFNLLGRYINKSPHTEKIWGRTPNNWCKPEYDNDRYCWINFQTGYNTVEFRLPKFHSGKQYRLIVAYTRYLTYQMRRVYNEHYRQFASEKWSFRQGETFFYEKYRKFEEFAVTHLDK